MTTNNLQYLSFSDLIIILKEGKIIFQGIFLT